jgi:hypothetical protein
MRLIVPLVSVDQVMGCDRRVSNTDQTLWPWGLEPEGHRVWKPWEAGGGGTGDGIKGSAHLASIYIGFR